MSDAFPRGKAAIVGAATFGMGEAPGYTTAELATHASLKALAQAGLTLKDVDGLFALLPDESLSLLVMSEYLGIQPR
jgi:acetyl-CoA acetyltransferase